MRYEYQDIQKKKGETVSYAEMVYEFFAIFQY